MSVQHRTAEDADRAPTRRGLTFSTPLSASQGTGATKPSRPLAFSTPMGVSAVAALAVVLIGALVLFGPRGLFGGGLGPSPSPEPATPSAAPADATATPEATPSVRAPEPTALPAAVTYDTNDPFAAIVLVNDLRVREAPATGSVLGALDAGDTVVIGIDETVDGMTWFRVAADGLFGWVAAGPKDDPWLDLRYRVAAQVPPRVEGIVGGDGFVAWGWSGSSGSDDGSLATVLARRPSASTHADGRVRRGGTRGRDHRCTALAPASSPPTSSEVVA